MKWIQLSIETCLALLCITISQVVVESFPNLAGSCQSGEPSVGGPHTLARKKFTGTLSEMDIDVSFDLLKLDPSVIESFYVGTEYSVEVRSMNYRYKGLLIRVEGIDVDSSNAIYPGWATKDAFACISPVVGVDHLDSTEKDVATGRIRMSEPGSLYLDITVVLMMNSTASVYGYSRYQVTFVYPPSDEPSFSPTAFEVQSDEPSNIQTAITSSSSSSSISSDIPSEIPSTNPSSVPIVVDDEQSSDMPTYVPTAIMLPDRKKRVLLGRGENGGILSKIIENIRLYRNKEAKSNSLQQNMDTPFSYLVSDVPSSVRSDVPSTVPSDVPSVVPSDVPSDVPSHVSSDVPSNRRRELTEGRGIIANLFEIIESVTGRGNDEVNDNSVNNLRDYLQNAVNDPNSTVSEMGTPSTVGPISKLISAPTRMPRDLPSMIPSTQPSFVPSADPSPIPSAEPSPAPSPAPSSVPSAVPSDIPSSLPSDVPSTAPTTVPSDVPSSMPSDTPSISPTNKKNNMEMRKNRYRRRNN